MPATTAKPTLEFALRPFAADEAEMLTRYRPVMFIVRRLLGVVPHSNRTLEIWPPAFITYNLMVPAFFDVPRCDIGFGISPALRSLVAHVASRSHGCGYCAAHTAVLGSVFKGPADPAAVAKAMDGTCPMYGPAERAAIDYAEAVGAMPPRVTPDHLAALAAHYKPRDVESIILAATLMGFLNATMATMGTVLEWSVLDEARDHLAAEGWTVGAHFDETFDAEIAAEDKVAAKDDLGFFGLLKVLLGCVRFEKQHLAGIAGSQKALFAQVEGALGFLPYYFEQVKRMPTRRAIAHLLIERLQLEDGPLSPGLRHHLIFAAARHAGNATVTAHAAFLAHRAGVGVEALAADPTDPATAAALDLARRIAVAPIALDQPLIDALMAHFPPQALLDMLIVVGTFLMLHRLTVSLPTADLEAPVAAFVAEHGAALGLSAP